MRGEQILEAYAPNLMDPDMNHFSFRKPRGVDSRGFLAREKGTRHEDEGKLHEVSSTGASYGSLSRGNPGASTLPSMPTIVFNFGKAQPVKLIGAEVSFVSPVKKTNFVRSDQTVSRKL